GSAQPAHQRAHPPTDLLEGVRLLRRSPPAVRHRSADSLPRQLGGCRPIAAVYPLPDLAEALAHGGVDDARIGPPGPAVRAVLGGEAPGPDQVDPLLELVQAGQ